jgi:peptidoglycan/xylan/chitin deacetylase (PgdA/CDA1 family)
LGAVHVAADRFAQILDTVLQFARIIPLRDLLSLYRAGRALGGLAALTFDDAYYSLLEHACPILRERGAPYTIFPVTEYADTGRAFWWDRLDTLAHHSPQAIVAVETKLNLPDAYRARQPAAYGPVRPLRQWILRRYEGRSNAAVDDALAEAEESTGVSTAERSMTWTEIQDLGADPAVDVGVHTRTHAVLPLLSSEEQRLEVSRAFDRIRAVTQRPLPVLAVPFGLFDSATSRIAADAGMSEVLSVHPATLARSQEGSPLPRIGLMRESTPLRVLARLTGWVRSGDPAAPPALPSEST